MTALTRSRLLELLHYDPASGEFTWISGGRKSKRAGCKQKVGYLVVRLDGTLYYTHRLALLYVTGEWPDVVDHINGERADNRWVNLRGCSAEVNSQNQRAAHSDSASVHLGVYYSKARRKFVAQIKPQGRASKNLGGFDTAEEAHQVYLNAKRELHAGCTI